MLIRRAISYDGVKCIKSRDSLFTGHQKYAII